MAERSPHGLPWGSLRWFQEPGHGKKLGEKGKYSRELLQKGLFAVPEAFGLLEEWGPFVSFLHCSS